MFTYNECLEEVGYYKMGEAPAPVVEYLAYKKGEMRRFNTEKEAKEFSHLVERVATNADEINTYWTQLRILEHKGVNLFVERVRADLAFDMAKKLWELCWSAAYEKSHSYGYDEVAQSARHYVDFANKVIMIHTNLGRIKS